MISNKTNKVANPSNEAMKHLQPLLHLGNLAVSIPVTNAALVHGLIPQLLLGSIRILRLCLVLLICCKAPPSTLIIIYMIACPPVQGYINPVVKTSTDSRTCSAQLYS